MTPELQELVDARAALETARARYLAAVLPARSKHSLAEVAVALGVSRQMAHKLTRQARLFSPSGAAAGRCGCAASTPAPVSAGGATP